MSPVGILVVDKPIGITSRKVVEKLGRIARAEKSGHAGTLDPLATGVLVVCLDRATLLSRFLAAGEKEYQVTALFGVETDTYDTDGEVLRRRETKNMNLRQVQEAASALIGEINQAPPPHSAVKHRGKPMYHYARLGIVVNPRPRKVTVKSIEVTSTEMGPNGFSAGLRVTCGPGTYIRSIVHEIGESLECGACVSELRRLRSGSFSLEDSVPYDDLLSGKTEVSDALTSIEDATAMIPSIRVSPHGALGIRQGKPLEECWMENDCKSPVSQTTFRILDGTGKLLALYGPPRSGDGPNVLGRPIRVVRPVTLDSDANENS